MDDVFFSLTGKLSGVNPLWWPPRPWRMNGSMDIVENENELIISNPYLPNLVIFSCFSSPLSEKNPTLSMRNEILIVVWKSLLVVLRLFIVILNDVLPVTKSSCKSDSRQVPLRFPLNIRLDDFCIKLCPFDKKLEMHLSIYIYIIYVPTFTSTKVRNHLPSLSSFEIRSPTEVRQLQSAAKPHDILDPYRSNTHLCGFSKRRPFLLNVSRRYPFFVGVSGLSLGVSFLMARKQHQGPCCFWKAHHHEGDGPNSSPKKTLPRQCRVSNLQWTS